MTKFKNKQKVNYPYHKYSFDRNMANDWNYESYRYWLICDEGKPKPPEQRDLFLKENEDLVKDYLMLD